MNQRSLRGRREARQADGEGRQTGSRVMGGVAGQGGEGKVIRDARTGEWTKVEEA